MAQFNAVCRRIADFPGDMAGGAGRLCGFRHHPFYRPFHIDCVAVFAVLLSEFFIGRIAARAGGVASAGGCKHAMAALAGIHLSGFLQRGLRAVDPVVRAGTDRVVPGKNIL